MENEFSKSIVAKLKILGIYQIAGGVVDLCLVVWVISGLTLTTSLLSILLLVVIGFYAYSIYCGTLLLKKNTSGLNHSLINQFLQLISLSILGVTFQYNSGVFASVGFDMADSFFLGLILEFPNGN
jgi:hypothetical protein